jgi:hypothetical protein
MHFFENVTFSKFSANWGAYHQDKKNFDRYMVKFESLAESLLLQLVPISLSLRSRGSRISIVTLAARLGRYIAMHLPLMGIGN